MRTNIRPFLSYDGGDTFEDLSVFPISVSTRWPKSFLDETGQYFYFVEYDASFNTNLYKSDDGAATWSTVSNILVYPESMACSGNGQYLIGVTCTQPSAGDSICLSSDYGDTWYVSESIASSETAYNPCISFDGSVCFVFSTSSIPASESRIHFSLDTFTTWSYFVNTSYTCGCLSSDGSVAYFGGDDGAIDTTSDFATFTPVTGIGVGNDIQSMWCNSNGSIVLARARFNLWLSTDSGVTWAEIASLGSFGLFSNAVYASDDGSTIYAVNNVSTSLGSLQKGSDVPFTIISIDPNEGPTAGGQSVTITGTGFAPLATATIDGNELTSLEVVDHTTITGTTPPGTVGAKDVTVTNP